jgi:plastocyanin
MRRCIATGLVVALAFAFGACGGDDDDGGSGSASGPSDSPPVSLDGPVNDEGTETVDDGELSLEADDFSFAPTFVQAAPGTTLRVEVENDGDVTHTFTIDGGVDEEVGPGDSATVQVDVPDDGSINFYCRLHRSQGMQGALVATS